MKQHFNMTLDEMQFAVYKMIPAEVRKRRDWFYTELKWEDVGLEVCHEAEKRLSLDERVQYINWLSRICEKLHRMASVGGWLIPTATYEQRLEALCRVWYPKRFHNQNT